MNKEQMERFKRIFNRLKEFKHNNIEARYESRVIIAICDYKSDAIVMFMHMAAFSDYIQFKRINNMYKLTTEIDL